ncbi:MAG: sugar phosphate isomerase/epimerase [Candidatus Hydrogenedentes bacterium]|nr:sugar phosphate isomerase/epimerase [Candidatus Hydrogenedentota bacterium]
MRSLNSLEVGVKSDPIEYRYSYEWLFDLMQEEEVRHVQVGSFFELYQLPDEFFLALRESAEKRSVRISSMFTAHRELGGFFRREAGWEAVARRNFERMIEVGALLGAASVGSNPGAVMRDDSSHKAQGIACYVKHMKELMHFAHAKGLECLTIEPMSCLAEPPTLPDEIEAMAEELNAYHRQLPESTVRVGYCADVSHGYADEHSAVKHTHTELFVATLPYLWEVHLKNTDAIFGSTFGFSESERARGIVNIAEFVEVLRTNAARIPQEKLIGYLEIGGPKVGRDYSDRRLGEELRKSLAHVKEVFRWGNTD